MPVSNEAEQVTFNETSRPSLPFEQPTFVFIGGAPRSGTTLLSNLLDGHPNALVFPKEHSTLERFFWNQNDIDTYARTKFINQRNQGQQTLLANQAFYEKKQNLLSHEFGQRFDLNIDFQKFKSAYLKYLENRPTTLESMLLGLCYGQVCANLNSRKHVGLHTKYLVYKQPFFTEVFSEKASCELKNCKFIHILRDPISRYVSAKTRRLNQRSEGKKWLGPINQKSYVIGHSLVDLTSRQLALGNQRILGESNYRTIQFENLIADPKQEIGKILDWLGIQSTADFDISPTRLGQPVDSGSTLSKGYGVDSTASKRVDKYELITSPTERRIHRLFLDHSLKGLEKRELTTLVGFLSPLPNSNWKNYICQLRDMGRWLANGSPASVEQFLDRALKGSVGISGAT